MSKKKSLLGFFVWSIIMIGAVLLVCFLPIEDANVLTRLTIILCGAFVAGLMLVMYITQKVYWINGISFEEAREAGEERRKAYALYHLKAFSVSAAIYAIVSVCLHILKASVFLDLFLFIVSLIAAGASTLKIKL